MTGEALTGLIMLIVLIGAIFIGVPISFTLLFLALTFGYFSIGATVYDLAYLQTIGMMKEEVTFVGAPMLSREAALAVMRAFLVPEDMGTPAGAIALRGATNFQTPTGWDTVYTPILNMIERPVAPMLSIRVETDWYAHETEFRYVLQPGEGITVEHSIPIGQVFFVPREEVVLVDCTEEELLAIKEEKEEFQREKAAQKVTTRYGLQYSPHYLRQSRTSKG